MVKRFKLQTGQIIKVDDEDAYLLRGTVWIGQTRKSGHVSVVTASSTARKDLSHVLIDAPAVGSYVIHENRDSLDFTKQNLKCLSRAEFYAYTGQLMREAKRDNADRDRDIDC